MRLFIAILPTRAFIEALVSLQDALARHGVRGRYTPKENLHLTLSFIGEYPEPANVLEVLNGLAFEPFSVQLNGIGAFGDTWWVGLSECGELAAYARRLRHALADAGIPFDSKRFRPHVTLLRRAQLPKQGMPPIAAPEVGMTVRRVSLMRSDPGRSGMIYTELGSIQSQR